MTDMYETPVEPTIEEAPPADLTGRDRMAWNVIASWAGQFVFIVAGFITPRLIDRRLGQETLGIWDFSWSMVGYFGLVQAGIGSSVNRYVARYRARGEMDNVSGVLSSVTCLLVGAAVIVLALTGMLSWLLPRIWGQRLGGGIGDAQVVLLTLGASLAMQMALGAFTGVVTGCHRWDLHNYIKAGWHAAIVVAMIVLLQLGMGIRSLAVACLLGLVLAELNHVVLAFALCPGLRVGPRWVHASMMRDALGFGFKTLAPSVGNLLLNQTSAVLVASFLGPAALALYSRPKSLANHIGSLVSKFAFLLTPTASALHSTNRREELRDLFIRATRYAAFITLPPTILLTIMGGPLLRLWMGPDYADGALVAVVTLGNLTMFTFMPAMSILAGLNAHGRPGMVHLLAAVASVGLAVLALGPLKMGLVGVALAVGLPLTASYGVYVTAYACRRLDIPWRTFLAGSFAIPLACTAPFAFCLAAFRLAMPDQPIRSLWLGLGVGGVLLAATYWRYVVPRRLRNRFLRLVRVRVQVLP
jgi:O-antigen/teichoic acid export membrane protein